jgi:hypothetical protein
MAHIWVRDGSQWSILQLDGGPFNLAHDPPRVYVAGAAAFRDKDVLLAEASDEAGESWVLVAGSEADVRVNGIRLSLGIRCLRDRDEIRIEGRGIFYFSTERLAAVEPFAGSSGDAHCPRCRQKIEPGNPSVQCPACGVWYHQSEDFPCWTYSETCALCPRTTDMDEGYRWAPEEI